MGRPSRLVWAILAAAGIVLLGSGAAAIAVGILNPDLISAQLPPEAEVDAAAVGGAAVALGVATVVVGLMHVGIALALRAGMGVAATGAVVLAATMAVLAFGFAVAALVSIASNSAPAVYMLPAATGLSLGIVGYAVVVARVIGSRRTPI